MSNKDSEAVETGLMITGAALGFGAGGPLGAVMGALGGKILGTITNPPEEDE